MPRHINPHDPFDAELDLSSYVDLKDNQYSCKACGVVLVRIEPNGILGEKLSLLDTTVILDHHLAKHDPMRPPNLDPRAVWGP